MVVWISKILADYQNVIAGVFGAQERLQIEMVREITNDDLGLCPID